MLSGWLRSSFRTLRASASRKPIAKRREDLGIRIERARVERRTERAAVRAEEAEPARRVTLDEQLTRMLRLVLNAE